MKYLLASALIALALAGGAAAREPASNAALAQETQVEPPARSSSNLPSLEERKKRLEGFQAESGKDLAQPEAPGPGEISKETSGSYQKALRAYYDYRQSGYQHRLRVFEWQLLSSKIIFVVVLTLVFAGIYFAAIQFHHGLRETARQKKEEQPETTEFVFSLKEFKVRSPVLGVIVLALSLAFFYLYLVYVYPIKNVF